VKEQAKRRKLMTPDTNTALVERYFAALREDKNRALDLFVAEEELKQHIAMYESSFPGYWLEAQDIIAERDRVSIRGVMHGVHNGPLMHLPPTGTPVRVPFFIIYRIADEKIVQHWMLVDMPSLMQQIGAASA
jgi:predicted ester cyclase